MAESRNYEEYRAQVLDRLGVEYELEDIRNFERWRLKVLEGLRDIYIDDGLAENAVKEWMDEHPEATIAVEDGTISKAKLTNSLKGLTVEYSNGFDDATLALISSGTVATELTLTEDRKVYDFKGATIGKLNIECVGSRIINFITGDTVTVKEGSRNCTFENCRFTNATQSIEFEANTWAFCFKNCNFIGNGSSLCMNADTKKNDTLILSNCYFNGFEKIINCQESIHITIIGGWCDDCDYIIYGYGNINGGNVVITGFDAEIVTAVFKCVGYTNATFMFNGNIGNTSGCICDFASGIVNLFLSHTVSPLLKIFGTNSPATRYVNINSFKEMSYPVRATATEQTIHLYVPANSTIEPFNSKIHIKSANCVDNDISFLLNGSTYTKGTTWNGVVDFKVVNSSNSLKSVDVAITSLNILAL